MLLFAYTTTLKRFVAFTCRYFKFSGNTTALIQSNCRNFSCKYKLRYWSHNCMNSPYFFSIISNKNALKMTCSNETDTS